MTASTYDRFLPLDLNRDVYTTEINGITKRDLKGRSHLVQADVDELFSTFELDRRTILHYGGLDERFIRDYFARHNLAGYERMHFFNFKRMICSTKFSDGSLSKDRLCEAFGIEGVSSVHTGMNDCKLEWQLFKAFDGRYLLATMRAFNWQFSALDPDYIVPVSYLSTFPNLSPPLRAAIYQLRVEGGVSPQRLGRQYSAVREELFRCDGRTSDRRYAGCENAG